MKILCSLLTWALLSSAFAGTAGAASILWHLRGELSALTDDPLGVDGEVVRLTVEFDVADAWVPGSNGGLYYPSTDTRTTISGGHTIAPNAPAWASSRLNSGGIRSAIDGPYLSFVIDGVLTTTFAANTPPPLAPVAGEGLKLRHLSIASGNFSSIALGGVQAYGFVGKQIWKEIVAPEPTTGLLLAGGLVVVLRNGRRGRRREVR